MSMMSSVAGFFPSTPSQGRGIELRGGVISVMYAVALVIAVILMPLSILAIAWGYGGTLINPAIAYVSWNWWRFYGAYFVLIVPPLTVYWLYQERKVAMSGAAGTSAYSRSQLQAVYFVFTVTIIILGAWITLLTVWIGIDDFASCSSSAFCAGTSAGSKPCPGAITAMVGLCLMSALTWLLLPISLYVHSAARDAYNARLSMFFPLSSQISADIGSKTTLAAIEQIHADASAAANPDRGVLDRFLWSNVAEIGAGLSAVITMPHRMFTLDDIFLLEDDDDVEGGRPLLDLPAAPQKAASSIQL